MGELGLQSPVVEMICEEDATECEQRADYYSPERGGDYFKITQEVGEHTHSVSHGRLKMRSAVPCCVWLRRVSITGGGVGQDTFTASRLATSSRRSKDESGHGKETMEKKVHMLALLDRRLVNLSMPDLKVVPYSR